MESNKKQEVFTLKKGSSPEVKLGALSGGHMEEAELIDQFTEQ